MGFNCAMLVDDDEVMRTTLTRALYAYGVGDVRSAPELAAGKRLLSPEVDLLLTSAVVAKESCLALLEHANSNGKPPAVVVLCGNVPRSLVFKLGRTPAIEAYLDKPTPSRLLFQCLDMVWTHRLQAAHARSYASTQSLSATFEDAVERYRSRHNLTNAEVAILRGAVAGMRRPEIAVERGVSMNTLKTQVRALLQKCVAPNLDSLALRIRGEQQRRSPHAF